MAAAAGNAEVTVYVADRVPLCAGLVRPIPVVHPFLRVAMHIVQAPSIWRRSADGCVDGYGRRIKAPSGFFEVGCRQGVAGEEVSVGAGAAGVLPFCLSGKTVGQAFLSGEPLTEAVGVMPGDEHYRLVIARGETKLAAQLAMVGIEPLILSIGHFEGSHVKSRGNGYFVDWALTQVSFTL